MTAPDPRAQVAAPPLRSRFDYGMLAAAAAVAVVLAKSLGAALGEPAAEDFDFLRHVVLGGHHSWLDGGGSLSFWRPLSQQVYYGLLGPLMLDHPRAIAGIHFAFLLATALLLYRLLRTWWPLPMAAAAATFPFLTEGARSLLAWPGQFADLGCLFFSVLALYAATRRRLVPALCALAAALLCKEQALVTAVLLPWLPAATRDTPKAARSARRGKSRAPATPVRASAAPPPVRTSASRPLWIVASLGVALVWAVAYAIIRRTAGLTLPHGVEGELAANAVPVARRLLWAFTESGRSPFGLPVAMTAGQVTWSTVLLLAALLSACLVFLRPRTALEGSADRALTLWGLVWFALSMASLAAIFPLWSPVRSVFGAVGLGVLLVAAWRNLHPLLVAALLGAKLVLLLIAAPPPATISAAGPANGDFMDFVRMARLQRLMAESRVTIRREFPQLPPHAVLAQSNMPREAVYAFGGSRALQAWYRDTTLRFVKMGEATADTSDDLRAVVQFQVKATPQVVILDPRALRGLLGARGALDRHDWPTALAQLALADSFQRDSSARVFRADVASRRAYALTMMGRSEEAVAEARRGARLSPENSAALMTLSSILYVTGDVAGARAEFDTIQRRFQPDAEMERLRQYVYGEPPARRDSSR